MNVLFFDTETTGLINRKLDPTDPKQPMPVQLGMKLDNEDREEVAAANLMIKTHGEWTVDPKASAITGINNARADMYGAELLPTFEIFMDLIEVADVVVAHNAIFDITVMQHAAAVYALKTDTDYIDPFEGKQAICTMLAATPIVRALPKRNGQYKWPKLEECMNHFFHETIEGAHDALVDVRATARVFYHMLDFGVFQNEQESTRSATAHK